MLFNCLTVAALPIIAAVLLGIYFPSYRDVSNQGISPCVTAFATNLSNVKYTHVIAAATSDITTHFDRATSLAATSTHDFYLRLSPSAIRALSKTLFLPPLVKDIGSHFPPGTIFLSDPFDQAYISRRPSRAADKILYATHYDGVLRLPTPPVCTLRTLVYLSGPAARFDALSTNESFQTHAATTVSIDFNAELHAVVVPSSARAPRLAVKLGVHAVRPGTPMSVVLFFVAVHRVVFFVAKAVLEGSRARETLLQQFVSRAINDAARVANNVGVVALVVAMMPLVVPLIAAPVRWPLQFLPYGLAMQVMLGSQYARGFPVVIFAALAPGMVSKKKRWPLGLAALMTALLMLFRLFFNTTDAVMGLVYVYALGQAGIMTGALSKNRWIFLLNITGHMLCVAVVAFMKAHEKEARALLLAPLVELPLEEFSMTMQKTTPP